MTIINPTSITSNNLVFKAIYTVGDQNSIRTITVGGTGADLIFEVNLLTISVGDSVSNGNVSPAFATYTTTGANNLNITVSPISTHYIDPGLVLANITGLTQAAAIAPSTIIKNVIVRNYGSNKYAIDDADNNIDYLKQPILVLTKGKTYRFDQSDSSNSGHPLKFSTTSNGTHGGGSEYTTGVTYNGTPGSAGAYTQIVIASNTPTLYYYCVNHSGMGGSTNIVPFNLSFNNGNVVAGFPITVPTVATNNSLGISGTATVLPQLTWATPSSGTLTTPLNTAVNSAYTISPYSAQSLRTASLRWTVSGTTKVMLPDAYNVTYDVPGANVGSADVDAASQSYIQRNIILPAIYEDTTATATITGSGEVTASVGTYPSSISFNASGNSDTTITNSNGATISVRVSSPDNWILLNGSDGTKIVDPDGITFSGSNYPLTINVTDNTTGSSRSSTITIAKYNNTRVTGSAVADQTINITQSA